MTRPWLYLSIGGALVCASCDRHDASSSDRPGAAAPGPSRGQRERVVLTVWVERKPPADDAEAVVVSTSALPERPMLLPRSGMTLGVIGLPNTIDPEKGGRLVEKTTKEIYARTDAIVLVSTHCLETLQRLVGMYVPSWFTVAVVVAPGCGAPVSSPVGVTVLVDSRHPRPVRISLDRATHAILNVE